MMSGWNWATLSVSRRRKFSVGFCSLPGKIRNRGCIILWQTYEQVTCLWILKLHLTRFSGKNSSLLNSCTLSREWGMNKNRKQRFVMYFLKQRYDMSVLWKGHKHESVSYYYPAFGSLTCHSSVKQILFWPDQCLCAYYWHLSHFPMTTSDKMANKTQSSP